MSKQKHYDFGELLGPDYPTASPSTQLRRIEEAHIEHRAAPPTIRAMLNIALADRYRRIGEPWAEQLAKQADEDAVLPLVHRRTSGESKEQVYARAYRQVDPIRSDYAAFAGNAISHHHGKNGL